jgi:drug/metabolite transporter (DMT)-like permease
MIAHLLLLALFLLTIGHLVTLKVCSLKLDHRTAPLFISGWTLFGLLCVSPFYGHLLFEGLGKFSDDPFLLLLAIAKGGLLYLLFVISQQLMQVSLSSRHYVTPLAVGLIAISNYFLGEHLTTGQWIAALGLCGLSAAFLFKGHMSEMPRAAKISYFKLVGLSAVLSSVDHVVTKEVNWFSLLLVSNIVLILLALSLSWRDKAVLKAAFLQKSAAAAGFFYMATELVKFYQMVEINPVSVVVIVQAMTKPVILVLSALIWHERTVKEQMTWGVMAFIITLPLFF